MRKLVLALVVLVALAWLGWQMLPGPTFAPVVPKPGIEEHADRRVGPPGRPSAERPAEQGRVDTAPVPEPPAAPTSADTAPADAAPPMEDGVRRDLGVDEKRGGHTIARHVARTDAQLRERLARESISAASTYTDLETAERVVGLTLQRHARRLERWEARQGPRANLVLPFFAPNQPPIGRVLRRGATASVEAHAAVVVLRWRPDGSYVLTSYPEERPREGLRGGRRGGPPGRQEP